MHAVRHTQALILSAFAVDLYAHALEEVALMKAETVISKSYGGQLQFLTIIGIVASLLHQIVSVVALLTGLRIFTSLQNVLLIISAPLEFVITAIYWPLKLYNPSLLIDRTISTPIPPSLDRRLHMYPAMFQFASATFYAQKKWVGPIIYPLSLIIGMAGSYWCWFEHTYKTNGFYPYPFLAIMTTQQKFGLIVGAAVIALMSYKFLQLMQSIFI